MNHLTAREQGLFTASENAEQCTNVSHQTFASFSHATFVFRCKTSMVCFLHIKGVEPINIHCEISFVYSSAHMQMVHCWVKVLDEGRTEVHNIPHLDRLIEATNENSITIVRAILEED